MPGEGRKLTEGGGSFDEFQSEDIVGKSAIDAVAKHLGLLQAIEDENIFSLGSTMIHIGSRYGNAGALNVLAATATFRSCRTEKFGTNIRTARR